MQLLSPLRDLALLLVTIFGLAACSQAEKAGPVVLAASSIQEALGMAADEWAARGHPRPVLSFAASSGLARQLQNGAPADLYISADQQWMDIVEGGGLLRPDTRRNLLSNRIVLVAPKRSGDAIEVTGPALSTMLGNGYFAMADPDTVPAGRYGKAALEHLGAWEAVEGRIARAENVRAALALVGSGEAPLGLVYATDAAASDAVRVVGSFPPGSHPPIRYPLAVLAGSDHPDAEAFARFLVSDEGQAIFARYGFGPPS